MRAALPLIVLCLLAMPGCGSMLTDQPGVYAVSTEEVPTDQRVIHATYVKPAHDRHPGNLLVFTTGDDGWLGTSGVIFRHLADQGYTIAGFSAPEILKPVIRADERVSVDRAARALQEMYTHVRAHLGLPSTTPIIVVGFSRGASMVAFTAVHPELKHEIAGAVALALVREADYLHIPASERSANLQVDEQGRLQLYPTLKLLGSTKLAVIQSENDGYVKSAESRRLLGPDTPTLRLYEVAARDHGFRGGRDVMFQDLDQALQWVEQ